MLQNSLASITDVVAGHLQPIHIVHHPNYFCWKHAWLVWKRFVPGDHATGKECLKQWCLHLWYLLLAFGSCFRGYFHAETVEWILHCFSKSQCCRRWTPPVSVLYSVRIWSSTVPSTWMARQLCWCSATSQLTSVQGSTIGNYNGGKQGFSWWIHPKVCQVIQVICCPASGLLLPLRYLYSRQYMKSEKFHATVS